MSMRTLPPGRLQHLARSIWKLGDRVLFELLDETLHDSHGDLAARLVRYAAIPPEALYVARGDRFAPRLIAFGSKR